MKKAIFFLFAALIALVSCNREMDSPEDFVKGKVTFKASIVETKTHLGAKEGTSWPNYWSTSDVISVNGVVSEPLDASFDGSASAKFTVDGVAAPFFAAYPASAVSAYADGAATIQIPAEQLFVDGSYDPAAYIMLGKSTGDDLAFVPQMAIFSITPTGEEGTLIKSVSLTSLGDKKIAGSFTTDFESLTAGTDAVSTVTVSALEGIDVGKPWMIAIPASDFTAEGIKIVITDEDGGCMTRTAVPSKAYVAGKMYSVSIPYAADPLSLTVEGITSSTAVICWSTSPDSAYTINVYSDAGCATLLDSYSVDAGNSCWGGQSPRFCVSGLAPGMTYYVKVTNDDLSVESDVLPFTTEAFTVVEVSDTPAAIGDVILAEDFGELRWDCDVIGVGVGWFPTSAAQASFSTVEIGSFQAAATSSEKQISAQASAVAASRLAHWAQGENPHMYVHPGYIKLVGQKKVTHLVTPALDNIPEGKLATLDVEVTASAYYSESSGSYCTTDAVIAVQTEEISNELAGGTESVNTLDLSTNVQPITLDEATAWKSYKVTLTGVGKGARLAFGAASNVTGNDARMNISDIKVTITDLEEPGLEASSKAVSSSTAAFTWTYGGEAAADIAKPYTIALYSDSSCSNLVVSYDIEADHSCWNGKTPSFVFSGLNPSTEYWFIATDTEANVSSDPVSATTEAFTVVDATTVTTAAVDDIILAEDFSEVMWGGDLPNASAGYNGNESVANSMTSREASNFVAGATTTTELLLAKNVYNTEGLRLRNWAQGKNNIYMHPGYIKISTSSTNNAHIITPALNSLPADKLATLEVTITAAGWGSNYKAVAAIQHSNAADILNMSESSGQSNTVAFDNFSQITLNGGTQKWSTQTITVSGVQKGDRIAVGSTETVAKGEGRMMISDIVIKVKELVSNEHESLEISDFATLKAFLTSCASLPAANGTVTADITLTDEQEADIAALYPIPVYDATLEGGGFTISGLKKPFINILKGPVSNLTLESEIEITEAKNNIGIFAAEASSPATFSGCVSKGSLEMSSEETVSGNLSIGGMVGYADNVTFTNCENQATVSNSATASVGTMIGGLAGTSEESTYVGCSNNADVSNYGLATDFSGMPCDISIGGIAGYLKGDNTLTGTSSVYNSNSGTIKENSTSKYVGIGGIAGMNDGSGSDIAYAKNSGDISYSGNTRYNSYVGGILGCAHAICTMDYASNEGDLIFRSLTISHQVWVGGILGGFNASNTNTKNASLRITGCVNSGDIDCPNSNSGANMAASSSSVTSFSYMGGICGVGDCGSKEFINCSNSGHIAVYNQLKMRLGGIVGYVTMNPTGCVNTGAVNYCRYKGPGNTGASVVGGIVGYTGIATPHDLTNDATVRTTGSSPASYCGGIAGQVGGDTTGFLNCNVGSSTGSQKTISGAGEGSFAKSNAAGLFTAVSSSRAWDFTGCKVLNGTKCQNLTITNENLEAALIGNNKPPTNVTNLPTLVDSF